MQRESNMIKQFWMIETGSSAKFRLIVLEKDMNAPKGEFRILEIYEYDNKRALMRRMMKEYPKAEEMMKCA